MRFRPPDWLVGLIIKHASSTPYFHLKHADGSPYMDRWWLLPRWLLREEKSDGRTVFKPAAWLPFAVRLHHILSSDIDRHLHDHPFGYWTWILRGGYWETTPADIDPRFTRWGREIVRQAWRPAGAILRRRASDRHLLTLDADSTWTIFIQFRKVQPWGFYTPGGKVYWYDYDKISPTDPEIPLRRIAALREPR